MIMPKGQQLLLPVNPVFIAASLVAALALNMLPLFQQLGILAFGKVKPTARTLNWWAKL